MTNNEQELELLRAFYKLSLNFKLAFIAQKFTALWIKQNEIQIFYRSHDVSKRSNDAHISERPQLDVCKQLVSQSTKVAAHENPTTFQDVDAVPYSEPNRHIGPQLRF